MEVYPAPGFFLFHILNNLMMKNSIKKQLLVLLIVLNIIPVFSARATDAPIVTIPVIENAVSQELVTVPLLVSNFDSISAFTLSLDFKYDNLEYVSGSYNQELGGTCDIGVVDLGDGTHRLTISWYILAENGISLPDSTVLAEYTFRYISGVANLIWYDNGPSCTFSDSDANTLNDEPASVFYTDGAVADSTVTNVSAIDLNKSLHFYSNQYHQLCVSTDIQPNTIIKLFDLRGGLILSEKISHGGQLAVELPVLKAGFYIVHAEYGENIQREKLWIKGS